MLTIAFGDRHSDVTRDEKKREVGDYALHIQCAWRLTRTDSIVIGFADYVAADEKQELIMKIYDCLKEALSGSPIVESVSYIQGGGFSLALENDLYVEAFPSLATQDQDAEFWRFFRPKWPSPHFVVTPMGVDVT